jgi:hypothetical protein
MSELDDFEEISTLDVKDKRKSATTTIQSVASNKRQVVKEVEVIGAGPMKKDRAVEHPFFVYVFNTSTPDESGTPYGSFLPEPIPHKYINVTYTNKEKTSFRYNVSILASSEWALPDQQDSELRFYVTPELIDFSDKENVEAHIAIARKGTSVKDYFQLQNDGQQVENSRTKGYEYRIPAP